MCLKTLEKFKVHRYHGWQIFRIRNGKLFGLYYNINEEVRLDEWMEDKNERVLLTDSWGGFRNYPTGYHIFLKKEDAEITARIAQTSQREVIVKKVKFTEVVAKGCQFGGKKTTVARKRYVLKNSGKV